MGTPVYSKKRGFSQAVSYVALFNRQEVKDTLRKAVTIFRPSKHNFANGFSCTHRIFFAIAAFLILAYSINVLTVSLMYSRNLTTERNLMVSHFWPGEHDFTSAYVPLHVSRFDRPWLLPKRVSLLTLKQSRNRVLYSALREKAGDGIGHAFGTMNAEIGVALRFGLSYSHRKAEYASLTAIDHNAVESFFGWGVDAINRSWVRENFCHSSYDGKNITDHNKTKCQRCEKLKNGVVLNQVRFEELVEVPVNLSYKRNKCTSSEGENFRTKFCGKPIQNFLQTHNNANTIFQMPVRLCSSAPVDPFIDNVSRSYFFHKYWDLHGGPHRKHPRYSAIPIEKSAIENEQMTIIGRPPVIFSEDTLVFAVHARRGDFFKVKRAMISCETFGVVIRQVMSIIHAHGGVFSQLPVAVHIYSEGKPKDRDIHAGHNINSMSKDFYDSDGIERSASWISNVLRGRNGTRQGNSSETELFRNGLQVHLHVATDTIQSLHEMIAADVFIGSDSAMGKFLVSSLSRGAFQLIGRQSSTFQSRCCFISFAKKVGIVGDQEQVMKEIWATYMKANEGTARRAYYLGKTTV